MTGENSVCWATMKWLRKNGYKYRGMMKTVDKNFGLQPKTGHIPVLNSGRRDVLIDHQGIKYNGDEPVEVIWVECKGLVGMSDILEGFVRLLAAVYYGGGDGLLAMPDEMFQRVTTDWLDFLSKTSETTIGKGRIGLFNAKDDIIMWLPKEEKS